MDIAQKETEVLLRKLEKELSDVYKQAVEETEQKIDEYFRKFAYLDLKKRQMVARGELTQEEYAKWRLGKVLIGERWHEMRDTLAKDLVATDKIAYSMVEGYMPEVYALNHNYSTFRVEGISGIDTSYSLYSRETVERLWRDNPSLLPTPRVDVAKDMAWNKKHIQGELTQAILQGEDIRKLSKRMERVVGMDETSARRNARTMITSAQNGGRVDAFTRAKVEYGIDVMNEWLATMDNRVRHSHAVLDGERQEIGKAFSNGCKYPGDPNGAPSEVYNCRCTLIPYLPKYTDSDWRDNNAEYGEWKEMHRKALGEEQKMEKPSDNGYENDITKVNEFFGMDNIKNVKVGDEHFTDLMSGAVAYVRADDASTIYIKDRDKLEDYIANHSRILHKNADVDSVIAHEIAHAISINVDEDSILDNALAEYESSQSFKTLLSSDPMNKYLPSWQLGAETISKTATTTRHELFAEAMADVYKNGDMAQELSLLIHNAYKKKLRLQRKG